MAPTTRESSEPKPNDSRHRSEISARISKVQPAFCPGDTPSETQGTQEGDLERVFAINTRATFLLAKAAHPLLKASRGDIVATARRHSLQLRLAGADAHRDNREDL